MAGFGRQMDAAAINWTLLVIDHLNPSLYGNATYQLAGLYVVSNTENVILFH